MSIKDLLLKIKGNLWNLAFLFKHKTRRALRADFFTAIVIVLVAFASFGLGKLSALEGKKLPVIIENNYTFSSLSNLTDNSSESKTVQTADSKKFVASKSGKKYFLPWCGSASNIKEGNRVWFSSEEEAKKAGYSPALNCRGI